ncbi:MAG: radical SAM protein, partial [Eggerthellaceae bacterium]|nr:radical SAM protein [Eggerthellaceae bacterium]
TYNEPLVGWEYVRDCAQLAREAGMKNAVVTNGAIEPDLFSALLPLFDAVNIDLKAFNKDFYRTCGMEEAFEAVKANVASAVADSHCHLEVTTLFVGGLSAVQDIRKAAQWLSSLDRAIPYHISQYHPAYRWSEPPVPTRELRALVEELRVMLDTVVAGNMG